MSKKRNYYSVKQKTEIALAAIRETRTQAQLTSEYGIHPTQIKQWKQQGIEAVHHCFSQQQVKADKAQEKLVADLYQQIGQLHSQVNWLKKKAAIKRTEEASND